MRLPSILVAMALLLLSGVVSVRVLETRMGGATVPGLIVIDAPGLAQLDLTAIQGEHRSAVLESVAGGPAPLAPFGSALMTRLRERGDRTALYTLVDSHLGALVEGPWTRRVTPSSAPAAVTESAALITELRSTRAFCVALALPEAGELDAAWMARVLVDAAETLPSFRRSSVVILGGRRRDAPGQRWSLRVDLGRWVGQAEPLLEDLLEARW